MLMRKQMPHRDNSADKYKGKKYTRFHVLNKNCNCFKKNRALKNHGILFDGDHNIMNNKKAKVFKFIKERKARKEAKQTAQKSDKKSQKQERIASLKQKFQGLSDNKKLKLRKKFKNFNNQTAEKKNEGLGLKRFAEKHSKEEIKQLLLDGRNFRYIKKHLKGK